MERMSIVIKDDAKEVTRQRERYLAAIGNDTPIPVLQDVLNFAEDAQLPGFYGMNEAEEVWYEMLEKDGLAQMIGEIADNWAKNHNNLQRAAAHVHRQTPDLKSPEVIGFGFCRFKAATTTTSWYLLEQGPGINTSEQTVVFIALEDLGPSNGFPFPMAMGQDVCMDGRTSIWTPPTGGGLALFFSLRL